MQAESDRQTKDREIIFNLLKAYLCGWLLSKIVLKPCVCVGKLPARLLKLGRALRATMSHQARSDSQSEAGRKANISLCFSKRLRHTLAYRLKTFKQQGSTVMRLGDTVIPYHHDFRMYVTSKLPNPHYSPEISTKVTLINFTLSPSGLEDQLLGCVVAKERPDLEEDKNRLIVSNARMKQELQAIEDQILSRLSSSQGNPVDDQELIRVLEASKVKAAEIQAKVTVAEETERDIDATRQEYVPVAVRTQILFFCVSDLANVDPMYQYCLEWFLGIFVNGIANSEIASYLFIGQPADQLDSESTPVKPNFKMRPSHSLHLASSSSRLATHSSYLACRAAMPSSTAVSFRLASSRMSWVASRSSWASLSFCCVKRGNRAPSGDRPECRVPTHTSRTRFGSTARATKWYTCMARTHWQMEVQALDTLAMEAGWNSSLSM
ncbi:hypothetical protein CRUP_020859 [Coryphaenoides rupestris]|nr:hypothetical protein CRUP_020859 [Coryphaenoides rupestris]